MLKELIDYSTAAIGGDPNGEEEEVSCCVLIFLSSKLDRDGANQIAKILAQICPQLNFNVRKHRRSRNYALEVSLADEEGRPSLASAAHSADRLLWIREQLENVAIKKDEQMQYGPDEEKVVLHIPAGTKLVYFLQSESHRLIRTLIPLHHLSQLGQLQLHWVFASPWELLCPPIASIRTYFGSEIALYFAWLAHFTGWLCAPALIGTLLFFREIFSDDGQSNFLQFILFGLFNASWAIAFLRSWENRQQELINKWDGKQQLQERAIEKGTTERVKGHSKAEEEKTGNLLYQFQRLISENSPVSMPPQDFWRRFDLVSLLALSTVLLALLRLQDWAKVEYGPGWLSRTSIVLQGLICIGAESIYRHLVTSMESQSKKETKTSESNSVDDDALILRLALFQSISAFCPLFYIAFWMGDWARLQDTLATLLITRQFVQNFTEIGIPLALGQLRQLQLAFMGNMEAARRRLKLLRDESMASLGESAGERQIALSEYGRPLDDYLEMFVQLGYVLLFSTAFPPAALCALLNNLLEARVDAFKLCAVHRRPWPRSARAGIDGWQSAIKLMCMAGVCVNLALVLLRCLTIK